MPESSFDLLLEQLHLSGPPALAMLAGRASLDPIVALAALEAAGLLDEAHLADDARALRRDLAALPEAALRALLDHLDVRPVAVDLAATSDADERERRLDGLVALSGVHVMLPTGLRSRTTGALERNVTWAALHPDEALPLVPLAEAHQAALDVPPSHPVHELLDAVTDAAVALVIPEATVRWDDAWRQAGARLFPAVLAGGEPAWARWAARLRAAYADVQEFLARPLGDVAPAFAGSEVLDDAVTLARRDTEEVVLRRAGRALQLGWAGDGPAPVDASLGDVRLEPARAPVDGVSVWWLPEPPDGAAVFTLRWPDREWVVPLEVE